MYHQIHLSQFISFIIHLYSPSNIFPKVSRQPSSPIFDQKSSIIRNHQDIFILFITKVKVVVGMSKQNQTKLKNILVKLWNQTQFSIWAKLAKDEANALYQSIQKLMEIFRSFHDKMAVNYESTNQKNHKLPIFHVINEEIKNSKNRVDVVLKQEALNIGKLIQLLAQFRKTLQDGQITATRQYTQAITETLTSPSMKLNPKKIMQVHHHYINMDLTKKLQFKNYSFYHPFERWYVDFSIRSEEFFRNVYSNLHSKSIRFVSHCTEQLAKTISVQNQGKENFDVQIIQKQVGAKIIPIKESKKSIFMMRNQEMEEESEDDIVKQIFREIQGRY